MRPPRIVAAATLLFGGCAADPVPLRAFAAALADAPQDQRARLWLADGVLIGAAAPAGPGTLPQAARTTLDAKAPGGHQEFLGREWGPRGAGLRVEKSYPDLPGQQPGDAPHFRSVLLTPGGDVLETTHSVPLAKVPAPVLQHAMAFGTSVERAEIVSGSEVEEGWRVLTHNRAGWTYAVEMSLTGEVLRAARVIDAALFVR
jgi:hypothetical protein